MTNSERLRQRATFSGGRLCQPSRPGCKPGLHFSRHESRLAKSGKLAKREIPKKGNDHRPSTIHPQRGLVWFTLQDFRIAQKRELESFEIERRGREEIKIDRLPMPQLQGQSGPAVKHEIFRDSLRFLPESSLRRGQNSEHGLQFSGSFRCGSGGTGKRSSTTCQYDQLRGSNTPDGARCKASRNRASDQKRLASMISSHVPKVITCASRRSSYAKVSVGGFHQISRSANARIRSWFDDLETLMRGHEDNVSPVDCQQPPCRVS